MKYFRHLTSGMDGDRLQPIFSEIGFHKGYALYFMLLELCAKKYNGKQESFKFEARNLAKVLQIRRRNLVEVLQKFSNNSLITGLQITNKDTLIEFCIPDLIEISDDYTKKVRQNSDKNLKNVAPKKKNKKENKEQRIISSNEHQLADAQFSHPKNLIEFRNLFSQDIWDHWISLYREIDWIDREIEKAYGYFYVAKSKRPSASFAAWKRRMSTWLAKSWESHATYSKPNGLSKSQQVSENNAKLWQEIEREEANEQTGI